MTRCAICSSENMRGPQKEQNNSLLQKTCSFAREPNGNSILDASAGAAGTLDDSGNVAQRIPGLLAAGRTLSRYAAPVAMVLSGANVARNIVWIQPFLQQILSSGMRSRTWARRLRLGRCTHGSRRNGVCHERSRRLGVFHRLILQSVRTVACRYLAYADTPHSDFSPLVCESYGALAEK